MGYNTNDYAMLRGVLSIAPITAGVVGTYVDVGNCPRFELNLETEDIDHQESRTAERRRDKSVTLVTGYMANFDLEGLNLANMTMFLQGTLSGSATILGMTNLNQEYALRLVQDNKTGKNFTWNFWRARIKPDGALPLIGENEWAKMSFSVKSLDDTTNHPTSPFFNTVLMTTTT